ncbi:putative zinc-binding dehydrogenase [Escherichia coli]|uniref:Putative zinc-binding dehydrogenase n=1 Tax=Escherichia coli TaxID=562 RepID=A0A376VFK4_ECOLX|nr:putative zinc-binding dehydrogenase [Escherichia coli]
MLRSIGSGNAAGRLLALQSTADWGRVVYIGETGKVEFEVSADLMHHQRRIIGSWVTSLFHMEKCAHDLTDWKLWPRNAITLASRWNRQEMPMR